MEEFDSAEVGISVASFVSEDRIWSRLAEMAMIGAIDGGGVNRQALTPEDICARNLLIGWARARGYRVSVDPIANLFIRREGQNSNLPAIMCGSHMDSQPKGGRFDGIYGVIAGLEVLEALDEANISTQRSIEVVAWTNEEGGRFAPGAMGSTYYAGIRSIQDFVDIVGSDGVLFADALAQALAATADVDAQSSSSVPAVYVEAHIEQGPILESRNIDIGVVTGIQGVRWFNVEIIGQGGHAGTTPSSHRADALQEAVALISQISKLLEDPTEVLRYTVGRFDPIPNTPNSIAGRVSFSIDLRHPDANELKAKAELIKATCGDRSDKFSVTITEVLHKAPCVFSSPILRAIQNSATSLGISNTLLSSGAFHDALFLAHICPTGMIFVPCENGISHDPSENAKPEHLAAGAKVLAVTLTGLAMS
jgi:N-carbamoyl-L-amino-acid hydrolase